MEEGLVKTTFKWYNSNTTCAVSLYLVVVYIAFYIMPFNHVIVLQRSILCLSIMLLYYSVLYYAFQWTIMLLYFYCYDFHVLVYLPDITLTRGH